MLLHDFISAHNMHAVSYNTNLTMKSNQFVNNTNHDITILFSAKQISSFPNSL